jgi:TPR repeat protein
MRKAVPPLGLMLLFLAFSFPLQAGHTAIVVAEGPEATGDSAIELAFWNTVKDTKDPAILQTYLDRYPNGAFAGLARVMMDRLGKDTKDEDSGQAEPAAAKPEEAAGPASAPETRFMTLKVELKPRDGSSRSYLGVQINQLTEDWAKAVGLADSKGALVISLVKGGPGEFAGVQPGDVIVKFDKVNIPSAAELPRIIADTPLGSSVELEVWRTGNGPGDFVRWLNDRAVKEDATAVKSMAVAYGLGFAGLNDAAEGVRWYRRAADLGDSGAMAYLANAYGTGKGVAKDLTEAIKWYRKAADQGSIPAMTALGRAYESGAGVATDQMEASRWYRKAADAGDPSAMAYLGVYYENGNGGLAKDEAEAAKLYRQSAEIGNAEGMTDLAVLLINGKVVAKDPVEAARLLRKASDANNARALDVLGTLYDQGQGVAKDEAEALRLYRQSADLGNADAMVNLGSAYEKGSGVIKDEAEALKLYRQAADRGNPVAMLLLGNMYANGAGVAKDWGRGGAALSAGRGTRQRRCHGQSWYCL